MSAVPDLSLKSRSADVGNWQRFLNTRTPGEPLTVDEDFGQKTFKATLAWQRESELSVTGIVGARERLVAQHQGYIPFVQAKNYTPNHPKSRPIDRVVIHTMENAEKPGAAEGVALWFAGLISAYPPPVASAHYCVDPDNVYQCVRETDVAWHAPGANHDGIGIEHAGFARQTAAEWRDGPSQAILGRSAKLVARIVIAHNVPVAKLSPEDLLAGKRGICGHADVTRAFPGPGRTHTDPGLAFPWDDYLALVRSACEGVGP